jgi:hypothetical protein
MFRLSYQRDQIFQEEIREIRDARKNVDHLLSMNLPSFIIQELRENDGDFNSFTKDIKSASVLFCEVVDLYESNVGLLAGHVSQSPEARRADLRKIAEGIVHFNMLLDEIAEVVKKYNGELIKSLNNKVWSIISCSYVLSCAH